jgi:drug/metabolite transporter (DMT)-like permease
MLSLTYLVMLATIISDVGAVRVSHSLATRFRPVAEKNRNSESCIVGREFENALDSLSWRFFLGGAMDAQKMVMQPSNSDLQQGAASRLGHWREALERARTKRAVGANRSHFSANDNEDPKWVLPPGCPKEVPLSDPYWLQKEPYYVKGENSSKVYYNACRYSNSCAREFTNLQRVESIRAALQTTKRLLESKGIQYILAGGSAIGAFRCKDVLPWDIDSDVYVHQDDIQKLVGLFKGATNGTGWREQGRSFELESLGYPGFILMEKYPGCMPAAIVDKSTGFSCDVFPMTQVDAKVQVPWASSQTKWCDTKELFPPCGWWACLGYAAKNMLPPSSCKMNDADYACAANLEDALIEEFGRGVDAPNIPTRSIRRRRKTWANRTTGLLTVSQARHGASLQRPQGAWHVPGYLCATVSVGFLMFPLVLRSFGASMAAQVFSLNVGLYMIWAMLTYNARNGKHGSAMLVLNALMVKFIVSLGLWRSMEGASASFIKLPLEAWEARGTLGQYIVPAGLYAFGDVLRIDALRGSDLSTFAILYNLRLLFLVFIWQFILDRRLQCLHYVSLAAIVVGCWVKELQHTDHPSSQGSQDTSRLYLAYLEIVLMGFMTAIAAVWNEKLLQHRSDVGVNLQNLAMYTFGSFWAVVISFIWIYLDSSQVSPFDAAAWAAVWREPSVVAQIVALALYGVSSGYFLKYLSNISGEAANGTIVILSVAMEVLVFQQRLALVEYIGGSFVLLGVFLFAYRPVLAVKKEDLKASSSDAEQKGTPNSKTSTAITMTNGSDKEIADGSDKDGDHDVTAQDASGSSQPTSETASVEGNSETHSSDVETGNAVRAHAESSESLPSR